MPLPASLFTELIHFRQQPTPLQRVLIGTSQLWKWLQQISFRKADCGKEFNCWHWLDRFVNFWCITSVWVGREWNILKISNTCMKVTEAVSYLRSAGHWSIALWLARYLFNNTFEAFTLLLERLRLPEQDFKALTSKYCDFLTSQGEIYSQQIVGFWLVLLRSS